jgi:membrane dipeptidase
MRRGWTDSDVAKLAGENLLRVMAAAEKVSAKSRAARLASSTVFTEPKAP